MSSSSACRWRKPDCMSRACCAIMGSISGSIRKCHVLYHDYVEAILASGGLPLLLPTDSDAASRTAYAELLHGLLVPGSPADVDPAYYAEEPYARLGPVNPLRTDFEIQMVRLILQRQLPVFGICGG